MKHLDGARIRAAIDEAERGTTARIGVHVAHGRVCDAFEHARGQFYRAGLHEHPGANAVLFVVAPASRKFAVYGGTAVHERLGEAFWSRLVADMAPHFAQGRPSEALIEGIRTVGAQLRAHFPAQVRS
jgi:uncharacterized membrane protein